VAQGKNRYGSLLLLLAVATAGCAELPTIGGRPLPPLTAQMEAPVYRDLADIPDPPPITPPEANEAAIQSLAADRERTAAAAQALSRQPFVTPDPTNPPGP
jgi:hypothetical protein